MSSQPKHAREQDIDPIITIIDEELDKTKQALIKRFSQTRMSDDRQDKAWQKDKENLHESLERFGNEFWATVYQLKTSCVWIQLKSLLNRKADDIAYIQDDTVDNFETYRHKYQGEVRMHHLSSSLDEKDDKNLLKRVLSSDGNSITNTLCKQKDKEHVDDVKYKSSSVGIPSEMNHTNQLKYVKNDNNCNKQKIEPPDGSVKYDIQEYSADHSMLNKRENNSIFDYYNQCEFPKNIPIHDKFALDSSVNRSCDRETIQSNEKEILLLSKKYISKRITNPHQSFEIKKSEPPYYNTNISYMVLKKDASLRDNTRELILQSQIDKSHGVLKIDKQVVNDNFVTTLITKDSKRYIKLIESAFKRKHIGVFYGKNMRNQNGGNSGMQKGKANKSNDFVKSEDCYKYKIIEEVTTEDEDEVDRIATEGRINNNTTVNAKFSESKKQILRKQSINEINERNEIESYSQNKFYRSSEKCEKTCTVKDECQNDIAVANIEIEKQKTKEKCVAAQVRKMKENKKEERSGIYRSRGHRSNIEEQQPKERKNESQKETREKKSSKETKTTEIKITPDICKKENEYSKKDREHVDRNDPVYMKTYVNKTMKAAKKKKDYITKNIMNISQLATKIRESKNLNSELDTTEKHLTITKYGVVRNTKIKKALKKVSNKEENEMNKKLKTAANGKRKLGMNVSNDVRMTWTKPDITFSQTMNSRQERQYRMVGTGKSLLHSTIKQKQISKEYHGTSTKKEQFDIATEMMKSRTGKITTIDNMKKKDQLDLYKVELKNSHKTFQNALTKTSKGVKKKDIEMMNGIRKKNMNQFNRMHTDKVNQSNNNNDNNNEIELKSKSRYATDRKIKNLNKKIKNVSTSSKNSNVKSHGIITIIKNDINKKLVGGKYIKDKIGLQKNRENNSLCAKRVLKKDLKTREKAVNKKKAIQSEKETKMEKHENFGKYGISSALEKLNKSARNLKIAKIKGKSNDIIHKNSTKKLKDKVIGTQFKPKKKNLVKHIGMKEKVNQRIVDKGTGNICLDLARNKMEDEIEIILHETNDKKEVFTTKKEMSTSNKLDRNVTEIYLFIENVKIPTNTLRGSNEKDVDTNYTNKNNFVLESHNKHEQKTAIKVFEVIKVGGAICKFKTSDLQEASSKKVNEEEESMISLFTEEESKSISSDCSKFSVMNKKKIVGEDIDLDSFSEIDIPHKTIFASHTVPNNAGGKNNEDRREEVIKPDSYTRVKENIKLNLLPQEYLDRGIDALSPIDSDYQRMYIVVNKTNFISITESSLEKNEHGEHGLLWNKIGTRINEIGEEDNVAHRYIANKIYCDDCIDFTESLQERTGCNKRMIMQREVSSELSIANKIADVTKNIVKGDEFHSNIKVKRYTTRPRLLKRKLANGTIDYNDKNEFKSTTKIAKESSKVLNVSEGHSIDIKLDSETIFERVDKNVNGKKTHEIDRGNFGEINANLTQSTKLPIEEFKTDNDIKAKNDTIRHVNENNARVTFEKENVKYAKKDKSKEKEIQKKRCNILLIKTHDDILLLTGQTNVNACTHGSSLVRNSTLNSLKKISSKDGINETSINGHKEAKSTPGFNEESEITMNNELASQKLLVNKDRPIINESTILHDRYLSNDIQTDIPMLDEEGVKYDKLFKSNESTVKVDECIRNGSKQNIEIENRQQKTEVSMIDNNNAEKTMILHEVEVNCEDITKPDISESNRVNVIRYEDIPEDIEGNSTCFVSDSNKSDVVNCEDIPKLDIPESNKVDVEYCKGDIWSENLFQTESDIVTNTKTIYMRGESTLKVDQNEYRERMTSDEGNDNVIRTFGNVSDIERVDVQMKTRNGICEIERIDFKMKLKEPSVKFEPVDVKASYANIESVNLGLGNNSIKNWN